MSAEKHGVQPIIVYQNQWSLAKADASKGDPTWAYTDDSFTQWHAHHNIAAFPYTPQANGSFRRLETGSLDKASDLVKGLFDSSENRERYKRVKTIQSETKLSTAAI